MSRYRITIQEKSFEVEILAVRGDQARVLVNGRPYEVKFAPGGSPARPAPVAPTPPRPAAPAPLFRKEPPAPRPLQPTGPGGEAGAVVAPMPGSILEVLVQVGDRVKPGDTVVKLEAMKMENDVKTLVGGVVRDVRVAKGSNVSVGEILLVVSQAEGT
jgi:biotin carboxyl carrier protein